MAHAITPIQDPGASNQSEKIGTVARVSAGDIKDDPEKPDTLKPDASAQAGVQKVQAITLSWTKVSLVALLCL
jgi:hypothetical protein